ncbi:hypothetical protein R1sor_009467 [Riccia sorocarpa]|uniref:PGG domain-containing protein n=1 Tax=Riccia sorocarpa TaxID=122646 RepID=A0ABD3HX22_9MARC
MGLKTLEWKILSLFKHLYEEDSNTEGVSSPKQKAAGTGPDNKDGTLGSRRSLDVMVLRDLLLAKEGDGYTGTDAVYSSGLDSLGMALIQGNGAVNTMLARAIFKVPSLFPRGHPYSKDLFSVNRIEEYAYGCTPSLGESLNSSSGPPSANSDSMLKDDGAVEPEDDPQHQDPLPCTTKEEAKSLLCDVTTRCFPELTGWLRPDMSYHDYQADSKKSSQSLSDAKGILQKQLCQLIRTWNLRAPYMPFAEYLLVEIADQWPEHNYDNDQSVDTLLQWLREQGVLNKDKGVWEYILGINDGRRTVLHYAVSSNARLHRLGAPRENLLLRLIFEFHDGHEKSFQVCDAAGRTSVQYALALGEPLFSEELIGCIMCDISWNPFRCSGWVHDGWACVISLESVHEVNGYIFFISKCPTTIQHLKVKEIGTPHAESYQDRDIFSHTCTAENIVMISPHIPDSKKRDLFVEMIFGASFDRCRFNRYCPRPVFVDGMGVKFEWFSPLQLAVLMGDGEMVELLMNVIIKSTDDPAMISTCYPFGHGSRKSALHLAAEEANPEMLRVLLETGRFDVNYDDGSGNTVLHSAVTSSDSSSRGIMLYDFLEIPEERAGVLYQPGKAETADQIKERIRHTESRRQGCINLLLQQGQDIWETNNKNRIADPGPKASPEYSLWWYEKLNQETLEQKSSFSAAAAAISVTAALIATASYVGPLQPPLGYSSEDVDQIAKVQTGMQAMRIFLVCNTLAFYLALAGIMLSLTPSLPMPQESLLGELIRMRRSVTAALLFLIVSMLLIFVAFASASLVVIPKGESWNHKWLTGSTLIVGGVICIIVWIICCTRAVRLLFPNNKHVRKFYKRWVFI